MEMSVGAYDAKTRLSELLVAVAAGDTVTITKHGRPVARLIPVEEPASPVEDLLAELVSIGERSLPGPESTKDLIAMGRRE